MQVVIKIPKNEIPTNQYIISVGLHFMDGKIVECDYPFTELEQEPCEDAISRKSAILEIQRHGVGCFDADDFNPGQAERFVINRLSSLPSILPKPKTDVLDEIRTEMKDLIFDFSDSYHIGYNNGLVRALQIIDKYKTESEG